MATQDRKTFAFVATEHGQTAALQYVATGETVEEAFETFAEDVFSGDRSVEAGWKWHAFEVPSRFDAEDEDALYEYTDGRSPEVITS